VKGKDRVRRGHGQECAKGMECDCLDGPESLAQEAVVIAQSLESCEGDGGGVSGRAASGRTASDWIASD
jgi:hypothetical protein